MRRRIAEGSRVLEHDELACIHLAARRRAILIEHVGKRLPEEREIVTYVRQLMRTNRIDPPAFDALRKRHDAQWLVELTACANYFALLSGVVNAFEVAAPADGDKLPVSS